LEFAGAAAGPRPDQKDRLWVALGRLFGSRRKPWHSISATLVCGMLAGFDGTVIIGAGVLAMLAYADNAFIRAVSPALLALSLAGAGGTVLLGRAAGQYRPEVLDTPFLRPWQAMGCWFAALLALLGGVFFLHAEGFIPRGWVLLWLAFGAAGLGLERIMLRAKIAWWRSCGWMRRRVLVVGTGTMAAELALRLAQPAYRDFYEIVGVLDAAAGATAPEAMLPLVRAKSVETVMIGFGTQPGPDVAQISLALAEMPIEVVLCPEAGLLAMPVIQARQVGGLSLLQVSRPPLGEWARLAKGLEDRLISAVALLFLGPVMLAAALAIKLESPGPVLFRQQRFGFNNRPISVLKFRSMYADLGDPTGAQRTVRGDKRITRVGRFLRRTSIDELPQLINVLRGEMSLVGPRAHPLLMTVGGRLYHEAVAGYAARHRVKPGITGLAQINGCRGEIATIEQAQARIRYDLEYVSRWSLWLDLKIMLLTPFKSFHKAY
jgi:putative colanic acid biosynthesis UDP-glucose lipid carrier transferase